MNHFSTLEFDKILKLLSDCALSETVKQRIRDLSPYETLGEAERHLRETTEAKLIITETGTPPLAIMTELRKVLGLIGLDTMLLPEQLGHIQIFLTSCRRMKSYLVRAETTGAAIAGYGGSIVDLSIIEDEIDRCIRNGQVDDRASDGLYDIRRKITNMGEQIKLRLDAALRKNKVWFAESYVAQRNGRFTLPVKREYRNNVPGALIEVSNTGSTCFIEPASVRKLQDELNELLVEEDGEVRRVLYTLTALVADFMPDIRLNVEAMETLDFLFAKAKLSIAQNASPVRLSDGREMRILTARHPLLDEKVAVPLDFMLGGDMSGVVITGPNTGGKTVALKTVGLLTLMASCGLHIPASADSTICMRDAVLCDIGDGQSITENLSTFSSHMTNIMEILRIAKRSSLVLLDELGSGTDPAEGMGLAVAILDELRSIGCLFVATTHYPEIKDYAARAEGLTNARMAFDRDSLMPLYRLEIGEAGESCAIFIAERLGMPQRMLERARAAAYGGEKRELVTQNNDEVNIKQVTPLTLPKKKEKPETQPRSQRFNLGDSVVVYPKKEIGIVFARANSKGEVGVILKNRTKVMVNHKRLQIKVPASELYPDDYDFAIVFDSVADRKAHRVMDKRHQPGNVVVLKDGENR